jgi:Fe-S cluster assembly protein SufD
MDTIKIAGTYTVVDQLAELYDNSKEDIYKYAPSFVNELRKKAIDSLKKDGFPDTKNEDYKYTNLEEKLSFPYKNVFSSPLIDVDLNEVFKCDVPDLETHLVLTINGWYYDKNIPLQGLPEGVIVGSFKDVAQQNPELVKKYLNKQADSKKDALVSFNTAFFQDGLFIYVPKNVVVEKPIQIINILLSENDLMSFQRNIIVVEENAEIKIVSCDHTLAPHHYLTSQVTEIYVEENASLDYYTMQNSHNASTQLGNTYFNQKENSKVISNAITLHGGLVRNNIYSKLDGEGAEHNMFGIFLIDKNQHVDNFTHIEHKKPNCYSNELFKGVLDDYAKGVFRGRILVEKDAQKTNAFQTNNNIILTDKAEMHTKPQLEIYADDVKCSHGATVGQLDEDALFYMRARGIDEKNARLLLMYAFAHEIIDQIRIEPLKDRINDLVETRFRGELSKCNNCSYNCREPEN